MLAEVHVPGVTMKYAIPAAVAASVLALPVAAQVGPSYDCAKAQTAVEHAICNDPDLSFLDREIAALYQAAQAGPDMNAVRQSELTARQRAWIDSRNGCASSRAWPSGSGPATRAWNASHSASSRSRISSSATFATFSPCT